MPRPCLIILILSEYKLSYKEFKLCSQVTFAHGKSCENSLFVFVAFLLPFPGKCLFILASLFFKLQMLQGNVHLIKNLVTTNHLNIDNAFINFQFPFLLHQVTGVYQSNFLVLIAYIEVYSACGQITGFVFGMLLMGV